MRIKSKIKLQRLAALLMFVYIGCATCQECFQQQNLTATLEPKSLNSPKYPSQYDNNLDCAVIIYNESGKAISIRSQFIDIQDSPACLNDYLSINGVKYCGATPIVVVLRTTPVQIIFHTTDHGGFTEVHKGFKLQYALVQDVCSTQQILTATSDPKLLSSPNYPGSYDNNLTCSLTINSGTEQSIRIQLLKIGVEDQVSCRHDYLSINEDKYCGNRSIDGVLVASPVKITFFTDASATNTGFLLQYMTVPPDSNCSTQYLIAESINKYLQSYEITSSPAGNQCFVWHIATLYGYGQISLAFISFNVGSLYSCTTSSDSSVVIYDGPSKTSSQMDLLCGVQPNKYYQSSSSSMTLGYRTSSPGSESFTFTYSSVGDHITNTSSKCSIRYLAAESTVKYLRSSEYLSLVAGSQCYEFHISTKYGSGQVYLTLPSFNVGVSELCNVSSSSYLAIYDGPYTTSPLNTVLCGPMYGHDFTSTSSRITLVYQTSNQSSDYFTVTYTSVGDTITNTAPTCYVRYLNSSTFPQYIQSSDVVQSMLGTPCYEWHLSKQHTDWKISLNVSSFNVGSSSGSCSTASRSYLAIYDGSSPVTSSPIAVLCGSLPRQAYTSSSSGMTLAYRSSNPSGDSFIFTYLESADNDKSSDNDDDDPLVGPIVGTVIGCVVALGVIIGAIFMAVRWQRRKAAQPRIRETTHSIPARLGDSNIIASAPRASLFEGNHNLYTAGATNQVTYPVSNTEKHRGAQEGATRTGRNPILATYTNTMAIEEIKEHDI